MSTVHLPRAGFRLARVGLHLAWGMATVAVVYPLAPRPARLWLKQRWSRQLLGLLGLRFEAAGVVPAGPRLLVSNHISWLDIFVLNALAPAAFVCKAEVRDWPGIGWLCAHTETVFLPRGSRSAARATGAHIADRLRAGWLVAVFPEGTTGEGDTLLPFHSALFQAAAEAQCPVQPVALRYLETTGERSKAPAYCGSITLWQSLARIAASPGLRVRAEVLPALAPADRRALASGARAAIAGATAHAIADLGASGEQELSLAPA